MGFLAFIGGLAFFLYGMSVMGKGLTKLSGGKMEGILARMCRTPVRGVLFGALVTAAIQSSSATTVMVVGFVNAGMMSLQHAVGVIMGANLGTTLTAWLLSLSGISGDNLFLKLLSPEALSPILATVGTILLLFGKREKLQDLGGILAGFGILFAGMETMSAAAAPLASDPRFVGILTLFQNPFAGLAAGALLTAVLQSSSASIGILQVLSATGAFTVEMAVPIVMGQNIGTCVTALLSGVGAGKNAKRAALLHFYFNLAGTVILLGVFYLLRILAVIPAGMAADEASIALIHTVFNLAATAILLPFAGALLKLATLTVREKPGEEETGQKEQLSLLDDRFLGSPSFALGLSRAAFFRMCELAGDNFISACLQFDVFEEKRAERIERRTLLVMRYDASLGTYLVKLSGTRLHRNEAEEVSLLISALPDAARIGERAAHAAKLAAELATGDAALSTDAKAELHVACDALTDLIVRVRNLLINGVMNHARAAEALSGALEELCDRMREHHVERLRRGVCSADVGNAFTALICDMESVVAHARRLASIGMRRRGRAFDPLRPMRALREMDAAYNNAYRRFALRYHI